MMTTEEFLEREKNRQENKTVLKCVVILITKI